MNDDDLRLRTRLAQFLGQAAPLDLHPGEADRAVEALHQRRRTVLLRNGAVAAVIVLLLAALPFALRAGHGTRVRTDQGLASQPSRGDVLKTTDSVPTAAAPGSDQQRQAASAAGTRKTGPPGNPAQPGPVPSGLYVRINNHGLVASTYDGTNERVLEPSPGHWALSPDRSHVLVSQRCQGGCELRTLDVRTGSSVVLDANGDYGSWSPDGTWILYTKMVTPQPNPLNQPPTAQLWVVLASGGTPTKVASAQLGGSSIGGSWSPDSTRVAYVAASSPTGPAPSSSSDSGLHVVNRDGSGDRAVNDPDTGKPNEGGPGLWSPDGARILLTAIVDDTEHLFRVDVDSGRRYDLGPWNPIHWLPEGHSLLALQNFAMIGPGYAAPNPLVILNTQDGSSRMLANYAGGVGLSPDNSSVAYGQPARSGAGWDTVHVESVAGTGDRVLGSSGGWDISTDWTPDGSAVVWSYSEGDAGGHSDGRTKPAHHTIVQRLDGRGTWHLDDYSGG